MKKLFIIAAAALVASVACSKVETAETTPDVEIGFQVASYLSQTKAGETSFVSELDELGITSGQYFKSAAYIHAAQSDGTVAAPAAFFVAGDSNVESINFDGTKTWKPAHPYYWPKSPKSSISFFSWYDFGDQVTPSITYTTDGGEATLAWGDRTVALKDNVMFADAAYHYKQNDNGAQNYKIDANDGVPTLFRHALAKVRFTVKQNPMKVQDGTTDKYTFWEVKLSDVALASGAIKNNGKFSLTQTSSTNAATQVAWTKPTDEIWAAPASQTYLTEKLGNAAGDIFDTEVAKGNVKLTNTAVELTGTNFMKDTYFAVMPQAVADNVTLTFKYEIKTYYGTEAQFAATNHEGCKLISTETVNVNELKDAGYGDPYVATGIQLNKITGAWNKWQMNHRYVYNLIINPQTSQILYDPAVETWETESTVDQTVPAA